MIRNSSFPETYSSWLFHYVSHSGLILVSSSSLGSASSLYICQVFFFFFTISCIMLHPFTYCQYTSSSYFTFWQTTVFSPLQSSLTSDYDKNKYIYNLHWLGSNPNSYNMTGFPSVLPQPNGNSCFLHQPHLLLRFCQTLTLQQTPLLWYAGNKFFQGSCSCVP